MNSALERSATYYTVLGINEDASIDEIKKSYKRLTLKFHPDVSNEENSTERFKEIAKAYSVLKDAVLRAEYDRELRNNESFFAVLDFKYCYREIKKYGDQIVNKIKLLFKNVSSDNLLNNDNISCNDDFFNFSVSVQEDILNMPINELEDRLQFSQNTYVRMNAALAIGQKKEKKSYCVLEKMLNDENDGVKKAIVWAIGNLKMKKSLQILHLLYSSNKSSLRAEILKAIYKIVNGRGQLFNELLVRSINDETEDIRVGALNLLSRIDKKVNYKEVKGIFSKISLKNRILLDKIINENKIQNYPGEKG